MRSSVEASERLTRGFDRVAPWYDRVAHLFMGRSLEHAQSHFIPALPPSGNILIVGGGTGKVLLQAWQQAPKAHFYYVELSPKMVQRARQRLAETVQGEAHVTWITGTHQHLPGALTLDAVITPFVLDCYPEAALKTMMNAISDRLTAGAKWFFTDFHVPESPGWSRWRARLIIGGLYRAFQLLCGLPARSLPPFSRLFEQTGWVPAAEQHFRNQLLVSRIYVRASPPARQDQ